MLLSHLRVVCLFEILAFGVPFECVREEAPARFEDVYEFVPCTNQSELLYAATCFPSVPTNTTMNSQPCCCVVHIGLERLWCSHPTLKVAPLSLCPRSESLIPEECSVEELESGEMKAICSSEGVEYLYRVRGVLFFFRLTMLRLGSSLCRRDVLR